MSAADPPLYSRCVRAGRSKPRRDIMRRPRAARAALEPIAVEYRADLVPLDELEAAAAEHGAPLADDVRPPAPAAAPPSAPVAPQPWAPDATVDAVGIPITRGFDGKPLKRPPLIFNGSGIV